MPSWITHLVTANNLIDKLEIEDKNSFFFGNVMTDILLNYIVEKTSIHKNYKTTHFAENRIINGVEYEFPVPDKFFNEYKNKMKNPIILGFYIHLLTDYFWNIFSYGNYYKRDNDLVAVKFLDNHWESFPFNDAIQIKQKDFRIFTKYLKNNFKVPKVKYDINLLELSKDIIEIPLTEEDIKKAIEKIKYFSGEVSDNLVTGDYKIFTENLLKENFKKSIEFINDELNKKI